jgi:predicted amidohydrolase
MIQPWTATCVQVYTHCVNSTTTRADAQAIVGKSVDRWLQLLKAGARMAGGGKQLFLYPEFALTGFPLHETAAEWIDKACIEIPGPVTERFQKAAQDLKCYIGLNAYERDPAWPGRYFNCSFIIGPTGDILIKYRRINTVHTGSPHDFLDKYLAKYGVEGTFPVAKTDLGNLAIMPCGEIMYPEAARMFMFRGAEVLLHPTSDQGTGDKWAWESAKKVRAAENMMYLISCNATGQLGTYLPEGQTMGNSKIIDYDGRVLAAAGGPGECTTASAVIDVEGLRRARLQPGAGNRLLRQRVEIYRPLYNSSVFYPANQFADQPMDSKARIMEIQAAALKNMERAGVITYPDDGPRGTEQKAAE